MRFRSAGLIWLAVALGCGTPVKASDTHTADKQLKQSLKKQVLSLRAPSSSDNLQFDINGLEVGTLLPAPWATCGLLQVKEVSLKNDALQIYGERVIVALRSGKTSSTILTEHPIRITLALDPAAIDVKKIDLVLEKIFEPIDFQKRIAASWAPAPTTGTDVQSSDTGHVVGTLEGGRLVYKVKPGVVEPPKPLHTPDPDYTDDARKKRLQGTVEIMLVVNDKGFQKFLKSSKAWTKDWTLGLLMPYRDGNSNLRPAKENLSQLWSMFRWHSSSADRAWSIAVTLGHVFCPHRPSYFG